MGDADRVSCTTYLLRDDASLWWEGVEHGVNLATITWPQFKDIFYEKYFTADARGRLKREFMSLRQGDLSVADYVKKFDRGCHFVPLIARDPAEKLRHFMDGLRPTLRNNVMMMNPVDYAAATAYAFRSEQSLREIDFEIQRKRQQHNNNSQPIKRQNSGPSRPQGPQKPQGQNRNRGQQRPQNQGAPPPAERPLCKECNRPHLGKCEWGSYKCFYCKESGHKAIDCPKKKAPTAGRVYVMNAEEAEEEADTTLITDSGATHSFISETFVKRLNITPQVMDLGFKVSIPTGDQMLTSKIVKNLELRLFKDVIRADLIVFPMPEFDIIRGMDWLSANGASIDFSQRSVSIRPPCGKPFVFEAARNKQMPHIISCLCAKKLIKRGCSAYLACVTTAHETTSQQLEDVDIVREFPSVFPEDVSGIPPDREVEFSIDLMPGTVPLSKAPYRLAPARNERTERSDTGLVRQGFHSP
ncbi:uncharacterized protein [Primulina eburnea]|uniref:uncharacterized protein n=1 Tax=Primulina eburnea TaxID=1245227 RepID=UPI003C6BE5A8